MRIITAFTLLALTAAPAFAGQAEAEACAAGLDDNGKLIFGAVLPQLTPDADLKATLTSTTKSLVSSGKISRSVAKASATSAADCLKLALK